MQDLILEIVLFWGFIGVPGICLGYMIMVTLKDKAYEQQIKKD